MKRVCSLALVVALVALAVVTSVPLPASASNYFCSAGLHLIPWNSGADAPLPSTTTADYALWLSVKGKASVTARVTLITQKAAWQVTLTSRLHAVRNSTDRFTDGAHVHFGVAHAVRYAFVDAAGVDGAALNTCPSVVRAIRPWISAGSAPRLGSAARTLTPVYLQALPALSCGKTFTAPELTKDGTADISRFGNAYRSAEVLIDVDSDGRVVHAKIYRSSGVDGIDASALSAAEHSGFKPATFLCVPVVSQFLFRLKYRTY